MKKRFIIPVLAIIACASLAGCSLPRKNSVDQNGKTVFPVSSYEDETLEITMGDVMPFYDNGVMNIYHLQNSRGTLDMFYHPISRLTTTDFVNYIDEGVAINFEEDYYSQDAALGTGSFIKDKDGKYHCFYTGHNAADDSGLLRHEAVRHAVSTDGQQTWIKDEDFNLYNYSNDFRDPYVYYDSDDDLYYMLVMTEDGGHGVIDRYFSATLEADADGWIKEEGHFFINDAGSYNMECPSYVEYNGYYYLAYSEQGENRVTHYRYKSEKDGEWKKFERDSIDASGFYAGRLEKTEDGLYAFAWCARLTGGSTGDFDWGGNLVVHQLKQNPDGELCAVMVSGVKQAFSTQIGYRFLNGDEITEISFDGGKFAARCAEKLGRYVTRMSFTVNAEELGGDFGITFGLDGKYENRLGQGLIAFDVQNGRLTCYNNVSSIIRYGSPLASVAFSYEAGKDYRADVIIDGEILTVYLDETVCLTARIPNMQRKNFAFYSNGAKAHIKEMSFYE